MDEERRVPTNNLLLAAYVLLGLGTLENNGEFSALALGLVLSSFASLTAAVVFVARSPAATSITSRDALAVALVVLSAASAIRDPGLYVQSPTYNVAARTAGIVLGLVVAAIHLHGRRKQELEHGVFALGLLMALALRVGMLVVSPSPYVDVYELAQQGAAHLVHGRNPYSAPIFGSLLGGQLYSFAGYAYPPLNLLLQTIGYVLTSDARSIYIVAECVFCLALWSFTSALPVAARQLLLLLFLFHPRALFVLEQAWTEPLILCFFGLALWMKGARRSSLGGILYGLLISLKPYLFLVTPHYLIVEKRAWVWGLAATAGALTFLPFALVDWRSLWENGLWLVVSLPFSPQSLTTSALGYRMGGWIPSAGITVAVGIGAAAVVTWLLRAAAPSSRYVLGVVTTLFASFVFGKQAFCNFYYLIGGMLLVAVAYQPPELHVRHADQRPS